MSNEKTLAIGIDLGGTKISAALVDNSGKIIEQLLVSTDVSGGEKAVQNQLVTMVRQLNKSSNSIVGIGIGIPGQIEKKTGVVVFAPNLKWRNVPLLENLQKEIKLPIIFTNDVRAATWAEWIYGAGKGCADIVCCFVGTGIGGGIVSDGRILDGASNTFGEIGHIVIDYNGPLCTCGNKGCFEAIASGWAIGKIAQDLAAGDPQRGHAILQLADGKIDHITAKIVTQAFYQNDPLAKKIIDNTKQVLIAGCVSLVNGFNPCRLILGGGVIEGLKDSGIIQEIEIGVKKNALKAATSNLEILPSFFRGDAGMFGAAALAFHCFTK